MEKEAENFLEEIFIMLGNLIKTVFISLYRGVRKLDSWKRRACFVMTFIVPVLGFSDRTSIMALDMPIYVKYIIYYLALLFPLVFLVISGSAENNKNSRYEKIFTDIGFIGRDKKYPYLCGIEKADKKSIYIFRSNIPLAEWQSMKDRLETGFDFTILQITSGSNKKTVRVVTLPSNYEIPKMIKWDDTYLQQENGVIVIGESALGQIRFDLNRTPHVLAAGETGSGKSVILRNCLWQMINQGACVYMIDFKGGVEFGKRYENYGEVITERKRALKVLTDLVNENEARLKLFRDLEVKNLNEYNRKTGKNLCRIGVFCDEIAEMLDKKGVAKEDKAIFESLEGKLSTLARLSRATGINLFLGVQRPDANVLTGQIKNNIPVRISGRFADKTASEIVLGNTAAVELPDIKGRFLYKVGNETVEFQSYYFDDDTMLKEVFVESGNMLTGNEKTQGNKKSKSKEAGEELYQPTQAEQKKWEAELQEMDEYDLNLDFGEQIE